MTSTTETDARITWDEIRRMSDEVELQIHLAGMDMKDRWRALAPRLLAVEKALGSSATAIATNIKEELLKMRELVQDLRDDVAKRSSRQLVL